MRGASTTAVLGTLGRNRWRFEQSNRVSVVYCLSKTRVIDWPRNPAAGVLHMSHLRLALSSGLKDTASKMIEMTYAAILSNIYLPLQIIYKYKMLSLWLNSCKLSSHL